jgi:hypothetical protein
VLCVVFCFFLAVAVAGELALVLAFEQDARAQTGKNAAACESASSGGAQTCAKGQFLRPSIMAPMILRANAAQRCWQVTTAASAMHDIRFSYITRLWLSPDEGAALIILRCALMGQPIMHAKTGRTLGANGRRQSADWRAIARDGKGHQVWRVRSRCMRVADFEMRAIDHENNLSGNVVRLRGRTPHIRYSGW